MLTRLIEIITRFEAQESDGSEILATRVLFECCGLNSMQKLKMQETDGAS